MTTKRSRTNEAYLEDISQKWTRSTYDLRLCYYDQFGFRIEVGREYHLFWNDKLITSTLSLQAAKEISTILINDKIFHTPSE